MTQPAVEPTSRDEVVLSEKKKSSFAKKLSPSASAILKFVKTFEEGGQLEVFQTDAEFELLRTMVMSYTGSLYTLLQKKLDDVVKLGGVEIITQRDVMSLIVNLWKINISNLTRSELPFLESVLKHPRYSLRELSVDASLSYAQSRRA